MSDPRVEAAAKAIEEIKWGTYSRWHSVCERMARAALAAADAVPQPAEDAVTGTTPEAHEVWIWDAYMQATNGKGEEATYAEVLDNAMDAIRRAAATVPMKDTNANARAASMKYGCRLPTE